MRQQQASEGDDRLALRCVNQHSDRSFQIPSVSSNFVSGFDLSSTNQPNKQLALQPSIAAPKDHSGQQSGSRKTLKVMFANEASFNPVHQRPETESLTTPKVAPAKNIVVDRTIKESNAFHTSSVESLSEESSKQMRLSSLDVIQQILKYELSNPERPERRAAKNNKN